MADDTTGREPMSDARLAEIRARAYAAMPISIAPLSQRLADWIGAARGDRCDLLAEVERLRAALAAKEAREAALVTKHEQAMAIVQVVAEADNSDNSVCYQLCSYDMHWTDDEHQVTTHNAPCVVEQARAALAPGSTARTVSGGAVTSTPTAHALPISLGDTVIGDATHPDGVVWEPWAVFEELMATRSHMIIFTGRGYPDGSGWVGVDVVRDERARWFRRGATETSSPPAAGEADETAAAVAVAAGPIFDLRDYGAVGGDVVADTAAFRSAVAAAHGISP